MIPNILEGIKMKKNERKCKEVLGPRSLKYNKMVSVLNI